MHIVKAPLASRESSSLTDEKDAASLRWLHMNNFFSTNNENRGKNMESVASVITDHFSVFLVLREEKDLDSDQRISFSFHEESRCSRKWLIRESEQNKLILE